jgi:hypothetical protein
MEQEMGTPHAGPSHDGIDALVASVLGWYERHFIPTAPEPVEEVAFSDEWERKQIARELHWN